LVVTEEEVAVPMRLQPSGIPLTKPLVLALKLNKNKSVVIWRAVVVLRGIPTVSHNNLLFVFCCVWRILLILNYFILKWVRTLHPYAEYITS
jgi:hypothetical protein